MIPEATPEWHEDTEWQEGVAHFWDMAHRRGSTTRLGRTQAHHYTEYFSKTGPFAQDLAAAKAVLDIGPGFADYLRSTEGKGRFAIDVSEVSRERVKKMGVVAHAPGEIEASVADLATCLSVIQHCTLKAAELVFSDAFRALRSGGHFYLNGIQGGHASSHPARLVGAGRCSYTPAEAEALAEKAGFVVTNNHVYKGGSIVAWVLYLTKP